jgi:hypothetical protein
VNGSGKYYYVIFFDEDGHIVHKGQYMAYRDFQRNDADAVANSQGFEYSTYDADYLRDQTGDEM